MKKKDIQAPLLGKVFQKIAHKLGATVEIEPKWKFVGQITFRNGRRRYFRYSSLDLNPVGSSEIAKDKDYANFFMTRMGYPTVPGKTFFSRDWCRAIHSRRDIDAAYRYALAIGLPVFVKPNSGSQGVAVAKAHTRREFYRAMRAIFKRDRVALVQPPVAGKDYRIVVLDKTVISAYERIPLNVVGDGRSTILQLLKRKQAGFVKAGRDTFVRKDDKRIAEKVRRQGLTMRTILKAGRHLLLLDNANLSTGGDAVDVTKSIHPELKKMAVQLTRDMGLRLCGVDVIVEGEISDNPRNYSILEVNAAPGLDHYVKTGRTQEKIVEDMYLRILKAMQ